MQKTLERMRNGQPVTIVVVGDSISVDTMWTFGRKNWIQYLGEALWARYGDGVVTLINSCRCGEGFPRLLPDLRRLALRFEPDLVINGIGVTPNDRDADPFAETREAGRAVVAAVREAGGEVLFNTYTPIVYGYWKPRPEDAAPGDVYAAHSGRGERTHRETLALAAELGCSVCDHYAAWKRHKKTYAHEGANPQGLWMRVVDTVHLNAVGHLAMFREIAPLFEVPRFFPWEEVE